MRPLLLFPVLLALAGEASAATLQQVMNMAAQHPLLAAGRQNEIAAEELLSEASRPAYNPELTAESQRRRLAGGGATKDWYLSLRQGIETGGKRRLRETIAQHELAAARLDQKQARQRTIIEAARAYIRLAVAQRIQRLESMRLKTLSELAQAMQTRLRAGEASQLDASLAEAARANALRSETTARQRLNRAIKAFRLALGDASLRIVETELPLPTPDPGWHPPANLLAIARAARPDLAAERERLAAAEARAELARANRIPDPAISLMAGREAGDRLIKLGISVPLPVLNSHRGAAKAALARREQRTEQLAWFERRLAQEVATSLRMHDDAMRALRRLDDAPPPSDLARRAYEAGEMELDALVLHTGQDIDARIARLGLIEQAWAARIELARAIGHPEYITEGIKP